jgi:hypothetical protein
MYLELGDKRAASIIHAYLLIGICSFWRRHKLHGHIWDILKIARRVEIQIGGVRHLNKSCGSSREREDLESAILVS